jgi:hypothetical protein
VAWQSVTAVTIRNVSTRRLKVSVGLLQLRQGAADVSFSLKPDHFALRPRRAQKVTVLALANNEPTGDRPAEGVIVVRAAGAGTIRIPWAITFGPPSTNLLGAVQLSQRAFKPSDVPPALLTLRAGKVLRSSMGDEIRPVRRLDVDLLRANGERIGLLARLRDVIPGHVAIGITGRDPDGGLLERGVYRLRLTAWPTERRGSPSRAVVRFRIR